MCLTLSLVACKFDARHLRDGPRDLAVAERSAQHAAALATSGATLPTAITGRNDGRSADRPCVSPGQQQRVSAFHLSESVVRPSTTRL